MSKGTGAAGSGLTKYFSRFNMSKLGCICGHVIRDQTDSLPYKATFIRDQESAEYHAYTNDIAAFIEAIKAGNRTQWINNNFSDSYPAAIPDAHVVNDIIMNYEIKFEGGLYQCAHCGRIKIQVRDTNLFASFTPEDEHAKNMFEQFQRVSTRW